MKSKIFVGRAVVTAALAGATLLLTAGPASAGSVGEGPVPGDPGAWAAIAISPRTGNVSYTFDHPTRSSAESGAVSKCRASDCQTVVAVANGCAAVAQASNRSWGWAYAGSPSAAQSGAVSAAAGSRARVIKWVCTRGR